jgi:hypothetical protein
VNDVDVGPVTADANDGAAAPQGQSRQPLPAGIVASLRNHDWQGAQSREWLPGDGPSTTRGITEVILMA